MLSHHRAHLDHLSERLVVLVKEGLLDVLQVNLGTRDHQAREGLVVGAQALHGLVEALGKVVGGILDGHDEGLERVLEVAAHLAFDATDNVVAGNLAVLDKRGAQLDDATEGKNVVKLGLVRAPALLAGLEQFLCFQLGLCLVNFFALVLQAIGMRCEQGRKVESLK